MTLGNVRCGPARLDQGQEPGRASSDEGHRGVTLPPARVMMASSRGSAEIMAPSVSDAQQSGKVWRVGVMATLTSIPMMRSVIFAPLIAGLRDLGYEEGRNIAFQLRSAKGHLDRLPDIAAEFVALPVDVFICPVCGAPLDVAMHAD